MTENICIFLTGYNDQFKSKNAQLRFKQTIKSDLKELNNLTELGYKYLKDNFKFSLVSNLNNIITFDIYKTESQEELKKKEEQKIMKDILKYKLKAMTLARTNKSVSNKNDDNTYLYSEYLKLSKMYKMALPAPNVILSDPKKYKKTIETGIAMLTNQQEHPVYNYLKALSTKIDKMKLTEVDEAVPELVSNTGTSINLDNVDTEEEPELELEKSKTTLEKQNTVNNDEDTEEED